MLYHTGNNRTHLQNIKLALLLGMAAGFVNAMGFLGMSVLTTNVTGHVALFAEGLAARDGAAVKIIGLWMLLFISGAYFASILVNAFGRHRRYSYSIPLLIEFAVLAGVGLFHRQVVLYPHITAGCLLFVMGMQNSLVTMISGSVVRTTHLTGTFTDLGIELADLTYGKREPTLKAKMLLHLLLICVFMSGALLGAWTFPYLQFQCSYIPAGIIMFTILADVVRKRKIAEKEEKDLTAT